ncbi:class I glutamine amidotransferase-like protein [Atractiella rhizophila]|nr:class I glutamine amidotransferase-like protein [Atractiella rhizophila]
MSNATYRIVFFLSTAGQDPSEVSIPWKYLTSQGVQVEFATEDGKPATCDQRMINGLLAVLMGATAEAKRAHAELVQTEAWQHPHSWTSPTFQEDLKQYDGILLPGGHDKGMRQYLESTSLQKLLADFFPLSSRSGSDKKVVAAICHGVLALARSKKGDKSVLAINEGVETTTLPVHLERFAYVVTAPFLGKYYRTYDAYCATEVQSLLAKPSLYKRGGFFDTRPFVVVDKNHYYVSARFPGDAQKFAENFLQLLKEARAVSA